MSGCTGRGACFIGLIFSLAAAMAQEDNNRREPARTPYYSMGDSFLVSLLTKPGVQQELGLDEPESQKLLESLREINPTHAVFRTAEERQQLVADSKERMDEQQRKTEEVLQKSLSEEQFRRFQQLELQYVGHRALLFPETARQLALTAEQQEKLKQIWYEPRSQESVPEDPKERSEKKKTNMLAVLTPEQMNQWNTMMGTPFKARKSFGFSPWQLAFVPEVHQELGLSEDEAATLVQSVAAIQDEMTRERVAKLRSNRVDLPQADRMRQSQQSIDMVRSSLTVSQWNRLQELILQYAGPESLQHPEVAKKLGLSREQWDRVRETIKEYMRVRLDVTPQARMQRATTSYENRQTHQQKEQADLLEILTPDQRTQWDVMQGTKVDPRLFNRRGVSPAGRAEATRK